MARFIILLLLPLTSFSQTFFERINQFLIDNVEDGKIDYQHLKDNPKSLEDLTISISEFFLSDQDKDFTTAFYINAYNILVVKQVVENYPINSPLDVNGFFKKRQFLVAGEWLTLDQIEFEKLFKTTKDPRIHFALGCGALSCPFLYDQAYTPDHLQQQLEFRAQLIIDRPNYVKVDKGRRKVYLNKIFEWYKDQFEGANVSLIEYVNKYRFYDVPIEYSVEFQEYDWTLNSR